MLQRLVQTVWTGLGWNFTTSKKLVTTIPPPPKKKTESNSSATPPHPQKKTWKHLAFVSLKSFPVFLGGWGGLMKSYLIIQNGSHAAQKNQWIWRFCSRWIWWFRNWSAALRRRCRDEDGFFDGMAATWDVEPQMGQTKKHGEGSSQLKTHTRNMHPASSPTVEMKEIGWYYVPGRIPL